MMKFKKSVVVALAVVSFMGLAPVGAQAKTVTTTPRAIRGTYYSYAGKRTWTKLKITAHSASIHYTGSKAYKLTAHAKSNRHKLAYSGSLKGFTLEGKIKLTAYSPFPEGGMRLTSRKIKGKTYKVIRGYQSGWQWDFIKNAKIAHTYQGEAR